SDPPCYEKVLARARFSATRARRLRELLRRWHALAPGREPPLDECPSIAGAILARLEQEIDRAAEATDR
ncbi:MAG TPA: hypothetical protein VK116_00535, partial [Planctomycetota bacterium]|nr:hypothetical protein [Planctomycetota bacterium]